MYPLIHRHKIIDSLENLRQKVLDSGIPVSVIDQALKTNHWFSEYYIHQSLGNILSWLTKESLESFCSSYPLTHSSPKRVGLILASNLPFVGFHDLLTGVLSGNKIFCKSSRRDSVLINWLVEEWEKKLPELGDVLVLVEEFPEIDFLIATGSNNTARYIEDKFRETPKLIRKHRYSIAVLDHKAGEEEMKKLCEDIFLYNGMGCRSICNIVGLPGFDLYKWTYLFKSYPEKKLHPLFKDKVRWERAIMRTKNAAFIDAGNVLISEDQELKSPSMGHLKYLKVHSDEDVNDLIEKKQDQIQCIVNKGTEFGQSQYPDISTFADNIDTMSILTYSINVK